MLHLLNPWRKLPVLNTESTSERQSLNIKDAAITSEFTLLKDLTSMTPTSLAPDPTTRQFTKRFLETKFWKQAAARLRKSLPNLQILLIWKSSPTQPNQLTNSTENNKLKRQTSKSKRNRRTSRKFSSSLIPFRKSLNLFFKRVKHNAPSLPASNQ